MLVKVPHLGDGVLEATVLDVMVSVGDTVSVEQTIIELETDKAVAPVPSDQSGKVTKILVSSGDTIKPGTPIIELEGSDEKATETPSTPPAATQPPATPQQQPQAQQPITPPPAPTSNQTAPAGPHIRKIATAIGLDLSKVPAEGKILTLTDLQRYIYALQNTSQTSSANKAEPTTKTTQPLPDFSKFGSIEKKPLSSLRKKIADNMVNAWNTIPHVTQFDDANITTLMSLRKKHKPRFEKEKASLTLTVFALKAAVEALKAYPEFNATYDEENNELILKHYYHIGVAVDTDNGLIVPVIRNVDKKSPLQLAKELGEIAEKARQRKVSMDDLQGASFTISNLGGLGVGPFTPIVNHPEVAILALSRAKNVVTLDKKGKPIENLMMPIGVSYDHRVIDGANGARFIRALVEAFENFPEKQLEEK